MSRVREWLGLPQTPDAEKDQVERMLRDQQQRLARIDAGLPPDRRRVTEGRHPQRRASD